VDNCVSIDGTIILQLCVQRPTSQPSTRLCCSNGLLCAVIRGRKFQVCGGVELEGMALNRVCGRMSLPGLKELGMGHYRWYTVLLSR
jgi:hypothetical protein